MSKVTKKELKSQLDGVQNRFAALVKDLKASGYICESVYASFAHDYQKEQSDHDALITILDSKEPQLKQLDQSAFDHPYVDDRFNYVALNADGQAVFFESKPVISNCLDIWVVHTGSVMPMLKGYDASNWQNSLIERDIAKELLEVDLSSELTGSELCKAMLARGDKYVMCQCWDSSYADIEQVVDVINGFECTAYKKLFAGNRHSWQYAVPINNQGEPLTAAEAGL